MTQRTPFQSLAVSATLVGAALFGLAGCEAYDGPDADADALVFPIGIAVHPTGDYVYVMSTNFDARFNIQRGGTITVFRHDDGAYTRLEEQTVWVPSYGGELALGNFDADGMPQSLYAVTRSDNSLIVLTLDPTGGELSCKPGGGAPASDDGNDCAINYLPADPFAVTPLPPQSADGLDYQLVATAGLGGAVTLVAMQDGGIGTETHVAIGVINGASTLAYYEPTGELYVGGRYFNGIRSVRWALSGDTLTAYVADTLAVDNAADTLEVRDIVFSAATERAYVTADRPDSVVILDMQPDEEGRPAGTYIDRIPLDGSPSEALLVEEAGTETLYVALSDDGAIAAVNVDTRRIEDLIPVGDTPFGMAYDANAQLLYVSLFRDNAVATIDLDPSSATFRHANVSGRIE